MKFGLASIFWLVCNGLAWAHLPHQPAGSFGYAYDAQRSTLPNQAWVSNYYDGLKRLTNHCDSFATTLTYRDANGNPLVITNAGQASRLAWGWDAYDRTTYFTNADGCVIGYQYDQNGNPTVITYPGNRSVTNHFDSLNHLTNVVDWLGHQTFIDRDLAGRVIGIRRFNGTVRVINRDDDGEITNIVEKTTTGFPIAFFTLGWNDSGRVAWEFGAPLPQTNAPPSRAMIFNDDNQIATCNGQTVSVDPDGNMTVGPGTNGTFSAYTFNVRNWLLAMGNLQYGYDAGGYRTSITDGTNVTRFVINPNAALPQVLMRIRPGVTNYYIYGEGLLYEITATATSTNTLTYHFDLRGSTIALTDGNGMPTDRIEYSIYGLTTYRAGTNDTPFLYNGRYGVMTDANGLLYMRARYYNPYLCRFINPDPSGFAGGLNLYVYADGNPVSCLDPFGLGAVGESDGGSWLTAGLKAGYGWSYDQLYGFGATIGGLGSEFIGSALDLGAQSLDSATLAQWSSGFNGWAQDLYGSQGGFARAAWYDPGNPGIQAANFGLFFLNPDAAAGSLAAKGTTALQPMAEAAFQTGTTRTLAGYELGGNAGLVGNTYNVNLWGLYQTSAPQGPFALVNALKAEASAAGATQMSITGNALTPLSTLRGLTPGMAGRLGLELRQVSPSTILLQGGVH